MNNQANTTVRELSLEDLDRVSGAGIKVPQLHGRDPQSGLRGDPGPGGEAHMRGIIGPEIAGIRGAVGPDI
jgi:hypothetical protein